MFFLHPGILWAWIWRYDCCVRSFVNECSRKLGRVVRQAISDKANTIAKFTQTFVGLKRAFDSAINVQIAFVSFRISEQVEQLGILSFIFLLQLSKCVEIFLAMDFNLQKLKPLNVPVSPHSDCQPDTRLDIIQFIVEWVTMPSEGNNVLWLHGLAGSGKSSIATTIAKHFRRLRRLAAFLPFDRKALSDPSSVIKTLAYRLGSFDPRIGSIISAAISNNAEFDTGSLAEQFELLLQPLSGLDSLQADGPIVVILDALDECGTPESRVSLLKVLAGEFQKLPLCIRVLVTSRKEQDINLAFANKPHICAQELKITTSINKEDVTSYLHCKFAEIRHAKHLLCLAPDWPGEKIINTLGSHSGGLFQWCSTAIKLIEKAHDPEMKVEQLVKAPEIGTAEVALYGLYAAVFEDAGPWEDENFRNDFQAVIGTILVACQALTLKTLDQLLGMKRPALYIIQHFGSVFSWGSGQPVQFLHPSLLDFLQDIKYCKGNYWFIDTAQHHFLMARKCFQIMTKELKFDMCQLPTSHMLNDKIVGLDDLVNDNISLPLQYSCCSWSNHLQMAPIQAENIEMLANPLHDFLHAHLLHWLECLSLMKKVSIAYKAVISMQEWLKVDCSSFVKVRHLIMS